MKIIDSKYYNYKAFTLAEVLITLLIIGVVASIIIPNLLNDTQDAELHTAWKKAYSDISQATMKIMSDNGGTMVGSFNSESNMMNVYLSHLSYYKVCHTSAAGNCWHKNDNSAKYLSGAGITTWGDSSSVVSNSGTMYRFIYYDSNCITAGWGNTMNCGRIYVDVNGFKGPNTVGRDIGGIWVLSNTIKPFGVNDSWVGSCIPSSNGWGCAAKYLYQ